MDADRREIAGDWVAFDGRVITGVGTPERSGLVVGRMEVLRGRPRAGRMYKMLKLHNKDFVATFLPKLRDGRWA